MRVYQLAFETAKEVYEFSKRFPAEERYSLTDQIRRSSRSVCTNIAEAWRKRRYPAAFVSKLSDADMECAETSVWLDFALTCAFLSQTDHDSLCDHYDHVNRQLSIMMENPDDWCKERTPGPKSE